MSGDLHRASSSSMPRASDATGAGNDGDRGQKNDGEIATNNTDEAAASTSSTAGSPPSTTASSCLSSLYTKYIRTDAFILSARVCLAVTLTSLFAITQPASQQWPQTVWMLRSAGRVTFMPSPDTGTALKRAIERTLGTVIAVVAGLAVGFLSMTVGVGTTQQAVFLGVVFNVSNFIAGYYLVLWGYGNNYTVVIGILTYGMIVISYYSPSAQGAWQVGFWRAINVLIGAVMGAIICLVVLPIPTHQMLNKKIEQQTMAVGKSAKAVLQSSYDLFTGVQIPATHEEIISGERKDAAYASYQKSYGIWKSCRGLFGLLKYDASFRWKPDVEKKCIVHSMTIRLARSLRLQTDIAMLDMTVRCMRALFSTTKDSDSTDNGGDRDSSCTKDEKDMSRLAEIGARMETLLDLPAADAQTSNAAQEAMAIELLEVDLLWIREKLQRARDVFITEEHVVITLSSSLGTNDEVPELTMELTGQHLLFYQLLEMLVLRVTRLYYRCLMFNGSLGTGEQLRNTIPAPFYATSYRNIEEDHSNTVVSEKASGRIIAKSSIFPGHPSNQHSYGNSGANRVNDTEAAIDAVQAATSTTDEGIANTREGDEEKGAAKDDSRGRDGREMIESEQRSMTGWIPRDWSKKVFRYDRNSLIVACRLTVASIASSLFQLVPPLTNPYPDPIWVIVIAQFVAFTASLDTPTAMRKGLERSLGTLLGSVGGIALGFLSLLPGEGTAGSAAILGVGIAIFGFFGPYVACHTGYRSGWIAGLATTTVGIIALGFYNDRATDPWMTGVYRTANMSLGAAIGLVSVMFVWPVPTRKLVQAKVTKQLRDTGDLVKMVLDRAVEGLTQHKDFPTFEEILRFENPIEDDVYDAFIKVMESLKGIQGVLPAMKYDPWYRSRSKKDRSTFENDMATQLARGFRIQTTVSMIDNILRLGVKIDDSFNNENSLEVLKDIGGRVKLILDLTREATERNNATKELLETDLKLVRQLVVAATNRISESAYQIFIPPFREGMPVMSLAPAELLVMLFQLVEMLIIRSIRVHYYCGGK